MHGASARLKVVDGLGVSVGLVSILDALDVLGDVALERGRLGASRALEHNLAQQLLKEGRGRVLRCAPGAVNEVVQGHVGACIAAPTGATFLLCLRNLRTLTY